MVIYASLLIWTFKKISLSILSQLFISMQIIIIGSCTLLIFMVRLVYFDAAAKICLIIFAAKVFWDQIMVIFILSFSFELCSLFPLLVKLLSQWVAFNVGADRLRFVGFFILQTKVYIIERTRFNDIIALFVLAFFKFTLALLKIVLLINLSFDIPVLFYHSLIRISLIGCISIISDIQ